MKLTEKQVTADVARAMRESLGLSQSAFWEPLGVLQSVGCKYEQDVKIPRSVRILLVTTYGAGLKLDTATPEGVEAIEKLAALQNVGNASKALATASEHINKAQASLGRI